MMNEATWMMVIVSGGFALLALLALMWSFATGQWSGRGGGAAIPLLDDSTDLDPKGV
ncbi:MAG: hypothetical protein Q7W30_00270 [Coriobacteriia bacterium]|nr:hypothetical protein [Coriobacteriia bacterium]